MSRRFRAAAALCIALLVLSGTALWPGTARATEGITVESSTVSYSFAQEVTFELQAASGADITSVHLSFRATGEAQTKVRPVAISSAPRVSAVYRADMRYDPLPPFATVMFWWEIEDAAGNRLTTPPQQFKYMDNRFRWEQLSDPVRKEVTVYWIEGHGDLSFGQAALDVVMLGLDRINAELRAPLPEVVEVYVYDSEHNLNAALILSGRGWIGAQARPELGVIAVAIPFEEGYALRMKRDIPHELTHLLVYQAVTPEGYEYVPEWLDEGLATANELVPRTEYASMLEDARKNGYLLPLENLCVPFPPDPTTALLSYAQSGSVVQFIRREYGAVGIRNLLAAYRDGAGCRAGVAEALKISFNQLEAAWRASLEPKAPWRAMIEQAGVWLGLWLLSILVAVPMLGGRRPARPGR
ncbi:MAG: peptidase MA family metallohydrolase [Anaerolineae bacterium]|nr:peptidase MA family metallohydrolase [Anaerolineae bacterium]